MDKPKIEAPNAPMRDDEIRGRCQAFSDFISRSERPEFAIELLDELLVKKGVHFGVNIFYREGHYKE